MSKLLYIEASPLKAQSHSSAVATRFLERYAQAHPDDRIDVIDLWEFDLPQFDRIAIEAKFAVLRANDFNPEQHAKWLALKAISERFNTADKYVLSVPMWNFGIPYRLKHYIDVITLAGENWTWSKAAGYRGLLEHKKALLIYSSAGDYPLGASNDPSDFQKPYLRRWLDFLGINEISEINVAPTLTDAAALAQIRQNAIAAADEIVVTF